MAWDKFVLCFSMAVSCVLICLNIVTFAKIWAGRRYKIFLMLTSMFLISNVGNLIAACGYYVGLFTESVKYEQNDLAAFGTMIFYLFSNEAHWVLAVYYMKIARNTPKIIEGRFDQVKDYKRTIKIGAAIISIFPIVQGSVWMIQNKQYSANQQQAIWTVVLYQLAVLGVFVSVTVICIYLIKALRQIKQFMSERQISEVLNVNTMLKHAASFGVFALSVFCSFVAYAIYSIFNLKECILNSCSRQETKAKIIIETAGFFEEICLFISQAILLYIFWELSSKQ